MSTQHSKNKNAIKKIKLDEDNVNVSSIAEYKRCAILKHCNENGNIKNQLDELFILNELHELGLTFCLYLSVVNIIFLNIDFFSMVLIKVNKIKLITTKLTQSKVFKKK